MELDISEDTSGARSIVKIDHANIISNSAFNNISGLTEMQITFTPSPSTPPPTPAGPHLDVEHFYRWYMIQWKLLLFT